MSTESTPTIPTEGRDPSAPPDTPGQAHVRAQIDLACALFDAADDEGTIQAGDALRLMPHEEPTWHETQSITTALKRLIISGRLSAEAVRRAALWTGYSDDPLA